MNKENELWNKKRFFHKLLHHNTAGCSMILENQTFKIE